MLTFVVMPCLNEADLVGNAVASLVDSAGGGACEVHVVVVDNGSVDGTLEVLDRMRAEAPRTISVVHEPMRGFVPPRRRGVAVVAELARRAGVDQRDVLVLQADADTVYRPGYVAAMHAAAVGAEGAMMEGACRRPPSFESDHPEYVAAERLVDSAVEMLEASDRDDVVMDDKVCAYRLSDYVRWGGLFEEVTPGGDQIHAETTRMFIRARLSEGAPKLRVNPAGALPSRRRTIEDPRYQFSTLGFPRETSWASAQAKRWPRTDVDAFARSVLLGGEEEAVRMRIAHLLALFRMLPAIVLRAAGEHADLLEQEDVVSALSMLPVRSSEELVANPATAVMDALSLVDAHLEFLVVRA